MVDDLGNDSDFAREGSGLEEDDYSRFQESGSETINRRRTTPNLDEALESGVLGEE